VATSNWLVIELSEQSDSATYPELKAAILSVFGLETKFFIPKHHEKIGSYVSTNTLFEGYVFVKDSPDVRDRVENLKESRFFHKVLKSSRKISTVDSRTIDDLRKRLKFSLKKKFKMGSKVKVLKGIFENLFGEVISTEDNGRIVNVRIRCMSREIIAPVPTTCVEEINEQIHY
jgi:transcription antitermination factor NusG